MNPRNQRYPQHSQHRRKPKHGKRFDRNSPLPMVIIGAFTLLIIILAFTIPRCTSRGGDESVPAWAPQGGTPTPTATPLAQPQATPTPTVPVLEATEAWATPTPSPTPVPSSTATGSVRPTPDPDGYLPIYSKRETTEKIIAITVDDCFQADNLRQIVQCAIDNGAKLTILPIGQNLEHENLRQVIRYAYENGMELENHTYTHPAFYRMSDEEMAWEIYMNNRAVSETLGMDYQMHFMRTRGGDNRHDLRTHQYIEKMGYYGMAHWTMSGSSSSVETLKNTLAPGNVYLFHTTDNDLGKLLGFIPYATRQGYKLVTLNEMFGFPENETGPLSGLDMPEPDPYVIEEYKLLNKKNNYIYDVYLLQKRLIELGWLHDTADGVYGDNTYMAVGYFQKAIGMQPTGDATPETQEALYATDAPRSNDGRTVAGSVAGQVPIDVPLRTTPPRDIEPVATTSTSAFD